MNMQFSLNDRLALVTGSSRGIGKAIALALAEAGADIAVHYAGNRNAAEETCEEIRKLGRKAQCFQAELSAPDASKSLSQDVSNALGAPDIVVANASIQDRVAWEEITEEQALRHYQVNVASILSLIQASVPAMRERRWGRILTIGSVQQTVPHPQLAAYAVTKSALLNLVRNLAKQLAPDGITLNNLAPGAIATDRNAEALSDKNYRNLVINHIPAGRIGDPQDCAGAALLLCSDAGRYITGADLYVDGGMSL